MRTERENQKILRKPVPVPLGRCKSHGTLAGPEPGQQRMANRLSYIARPKSLFHYDYNETLLCQIALQLRLYTEKVPGPSICPDTSYSKFPWLSTVPPRNC